MDHVPEDRVTDIIRLYACPLYRLTHHGRREVAGRDGGEAAADPKLAPVLIGLGVSSLSAAPMALPALATALARLTLADCRAQARAALAGARP